MSDKNSVVNEPDNEDWGGQWTEKKLIAFEKYVIAYLTILERYPRFKTIYFDGFAGAGERLIKRKLQSELFNFEIAEENFGEFTLYKGSASRILRLSKQFDFYYFIDSDPNNIRKLNKLQNNIEGIKNKLKRINIRESDCNIQLKKLAVALKRPGKNFASLILLDPFGMQINWDSISSLKSTRSDIWILIPSGVAINRLFDKEGKLLAPDKLVDFFGMPIEELKRIFYYSKVQDTLFGTSNETKKIEKPIDKIVEIYRAQLSKIWNHVSNALVLKNSKNVPIFHFIFASNNKSGLKIANDIIEKSLKK